MSRGRLASRPAATLAAALAAAAVLALFATNVRHFGFLSDDAFISFRYANHLVQGQGLVWNPGERVEGYTNFLWVLLMAGALALGGAPEVVSNALGIASGLALLAALTVHSARRRGWRDPCIWVAPLVLAASRSFTAWSTSGLETMFFSLLVFLAATSFLAERERAAARPLGSALLYGLAALTRPEGALFAAAAGLVAAVEVARRSASLRSLLIWALPLVVIVGGHLLWRQAYYGFWLPNTFSAKVPGAWWEQGLRYLALYHEDYRIAWFLPLVVPSLALRRDREGALFGTTLAVYLLYVAYVGGDRFEFRFLVPVLPFVYWLIGDSLSLLLERSPRAPAARAAAGAAAAALVVALVVTTHRGSRRPESIYLRHGVTSVQAAGQYARWRAAEGRLLHSLIESGLLPRDVWIAVTGAGALPYYTDWPTVDMHGLNDAYIAHLPLEARGVIAHERTAPWEYLGERRVAIVDLLNGIVHRSDLAAIEQPAVHYDGRPRPTVVGRVGGHYLIFATTLSDAELARTLPGVELRR